MKRQGLREKKFDIPTAPFHPIPMIYLDNNATTEIDPDVLTEMQRVARSAIGNPGSRHLAGRRARQVLEDARESIAQILHALPEEVVFTSGGTESNNLAITGLAANHTGTVLLPPGEHPSIEEPVRRLVQTGWQRQTIPLNALGQFDLSAAELPPLDQFGRSCARVEKVSFDEGLNTARQVRDKIYKNALNGVSLVTSILAHNETGVIHDLQPLARHCLQQGVPFHVDGVQAAGKMEVNFEELPATTLSASAHKFHGPRGIGILLVRKRTRLTAQLVGGFQEQGMRPGTEAVMLVAGMNLALQKWFQQREARRIVLESLRNRLQTGLMQACPWAVVNGDQAHRLSNTLNIAFPGCDADALLIALDLAGVCCSLGSACASGSNEPSPVLVAMGLTEKVYRSSLRLSLSIHNTNAEIDQAIAIISQTVQHLLALKSTPVPD